MRPLVIYHGPGCADGFTAAWVAWLRWGDDADYLPAQYGDKPPDVTGRESVYVLDFSYKREELLAMRDAAENLLVLDHHKSAAEELEGLPFCMFDMNRSGARLAVDYFFAGDDQDLGGLVGFVEDRDLWRWALPTSREISAVIASTPQTFADWTALSTRLLVMGRDDVAKEGAALLRAQAQQVERIVRHAQRVRFHGDDVMCANSAILQSEIGEALCKVVPDRIFPLSIVWYVAEDGFVRVSLRSVAPSGRDVSAIAKQYSHGGGHRHAAGFQVDLGQWSRLIATFGSG